jgi:hypothetical protein
MPAKRDEDSRLVRGRRDRELELEDDARVPGVAWCLREEVVRPQPTITGKGEYPLLSTSNI